jgi:hypothetical protein
MAGADLTATRDALHEHFTNNTITDIFFTADKNVAPIMAMLGVEEDSGEGFGRKLITPIVFGTGESVGADLTKVQAKAASATVGASALYGRWEQDPVTVSGTAQWAREAMDAAIGKSSGETFKVMASEMEAKMLAMRNRWAYHAVGDGTGKLGIITACGAGGTAATNWIQVGTDYINRFHRGMDITVAATPGTGACRVDTGGSVQSHLGVLGTDPNTGYVYLDGNPVDASSSRSAWATTDYVFNYNDRSAGSLTYVLPQGLKAWLPGPTVVDGSAFNGITRNGISELAGLTCDCSSLEPEDAFLKTLKMLFTQAGVKASALFCSANDYTAFISGKDKSKIVQIALGGKYQLGFEGMTVQSLAGNVPVVPDAMLPDGEFYAGPWDDSKLKPRLTYTGDLVQIDNKDGLDFRLVAGSAAYQMQLYSRGNIAWPAPGKFIRGYGLTVS